MIVNKLNDYVVYLFRNTINGKLYIGRTKNIYKRCKECNYKGTKLFYPAIQKYGWDKFEFIILKSNLSYEDAIYWEKYYITFFNTTDIRYGYNYAEGTALKGSRNGFFEKHHSRESIKKISNQHKGGSNPNAKPVLCVTTGKVFPSASEASDWCGTSRQQINRVCRGERKHTGKHPNTKEMLEWSYYD